MKRTLSYKVITLFALFCLSVIAACFTLNFSVAKADGVSGAGEFEVTGSTATVYYDGDAYADVNGGAIISVKNKLIADDLTIKFAFPENAKSVTLRLSSDSYIATGNRNSDGGFDKTIDNELVLKLDGTVLTATFNGGEEKEISDIFIGGTFVTATFNNSSDKNRISATLEGIEIPAATDEVSVAYYKLAYVDKLVVGLQFEVETESDYEETVNFRIKSIGQKTGNDDFTQTFELNEYQTAVAKRANAVVGLSSSLFSANEDKDTVLNGKRYTVTITPYAVFSNLSTSSFSIEQVSATDASLAYFSSARALKFVLENEATEGTVTFNVVSGSDSNLIIHDTYTVKVKNDTAAPYYKDSLLNQTAIESFKAQLIENTYDEYTVDSETVKAHIRVGSKVEIPSLKNLVCDDVDSYENLSYVVYYRTPSDSGNTTGSSINVNSFGKYTFFVAFRDQSGNTMKEDDFMKVISEDASEIKYGIYSGYIFEFVIDDDAPMSVTASSQGTGYVDVAYTATAFDIEASDYTAAYKLYFRAKDTDDWSNIPTASSITDETYNKNGFTYTDIQNIAYDGSLSFTPDRVGQYMIECTITSNNEIGKSVSADAYITVEASSVVKPNDPWLANNVWSVVFLSVGTVCLIAIIVLLLIKPKEDTAETPKNKK